MDSVVRWSNVTDAATATMYINAGFLCLWRYNWHRIGPSIFAMNVTAIKEPSNYVTIFSL